MKIKKALIVSDLHLGSDLIAQTRGFEDAWHFWKFFQQIHNTQVEFDTQPVFILGDIAVNPEWLAMLQNQLKGTIHLVLGNHDVLPSHLYKKAVCDNGGTVNPMVMLPHQKVILSHIPVHPVFFDGNKAKWRNIHGHLHSQQVLNEYGNPDPRYFNVSVDQAMRAANQLFTLADLLV